MTGTNPTPDDIRKALDVLGIDPDEVTIAGLSELAAEAYGAGAVHDARRRIIETLDAAVREADSPPVPVTRDTPAGTVISHPDWSDDGLERHFIGPYPLDDSQFVRTTPDPFGVYVGRYDGWVEVSRPEPEPAEFYSGHNVIDPEPPPLDVKEALRYASDIRPMVDPYKPPPVEVGQVRLMPVTVSQVEGAFTIIHIDGWLSRHMATRTVASWPLAPGGERP